MREGAYPQYYSAARVNTELLPFAEEGGWHRYVLADDGLGAIFVSGARTTIRLEEPQPR